MAVLTSVCAIDVAAPVGAQLRLGPELEKLYLSSLGLLFVSFLVELNGYLPGVREAFLHLEHHLEDSVDLRRIIQLLE